MQTDQTRLTNREFVSVILIVGGGFALLDYLGFHTLLLFLFFAIPLAYTVSKMADERKHVRPMDKPRLRRYSDPPRHY